MSDHYVRIDPAIRFGRPCVAGIPVDVIIGSVWRGDSVDTFADEYGITRADVLVACWYAATHGSKKFRNRWGGWAESIHGELWHGRYDVEDPPSVEDQQSVEEAK